ncbi:hypothetical protein DFH28DRAFT_596129 [Melampsora americana]|nr:hypothetical protein DFH28DRAFT_596129 [Melampsora americana]
MKFLLYLSIFSAGVLSKSVHHNATSLNSGCYRHMLQNYECVPSATKKRCPPKGMDIKKVSKVLPKEHFDGVGYTTSIPTNPVAGGDGICGRYESKTTLGVCLWSGSNFIDGSDPKTSGWLNGGLKKNCNKFVYIQRKGKPETIQYARVLDGCSFNTKDPKVGCFQMWMTISLFNKFKPSKEDSKKGSISDSFTWGFDNEFGQHPFNAPV